MTTPDVHADADVVRAAVYGSLAQHGWGPSVAELATTVGGSTDRVRVALRALADRHAVVLDSHGAVRMAHPFSASPMGFVVRPRDGFDARRWWGGCAWDSFGISAALGLDVVVATTCPLCRGHLRVCCGPDVPPPDELCVRVPRPAAHWWPDVVATCSAIRLFCTREHAQRWVDTDPRRAGGELVPAVTMWRLAQPWYGDRLDIDYASHDRGHNQALLQDVGLTGEFWRLP